MKKDDSMMYVVKVVIVAFIAAAASLYLNLGYGAATVAGAILVVLGLVAKQKSLSTKFGVPKDWARGAVILVGIGLVAGIPALTGIFNMGFQPISGAIEGSAGGEVSPPPADTGVTGRTTGTPTQDTQPSGTTVLGTTATYTISAEAALNATQTGINPTGGYYKLTPDGSYIALAAFASSKTTIASLDPRATIPRVAVGQDGAFYTDIKENVNLNNQLSPSDTFKLVAVPNAGGVGVKAYDSIYNEISSSGSGSNDVCAACTNISIGAGGVLSGFVRIEVNQTGGYKGIRHPVIVVELNTSLWDTSLSSVTGATVIDCPVSLVTASQGRTVAQCWDLGYDWAVSAGAKTTDLRNPTGGTASFWKGFKDFQFLYQSKSTADDPDGANKGANNFYSGHRIVFYVADMDKFFRASDPNKLHFLNPDDSNSDLGTTTEYTVAVAPA